MNAVKFMKMDFLKIKSQMKLMIFIIVFVMVFSFKMLTKEMLAWSVMYMIFMGIIMASMPFSIDATGSGGFVTLLPAKARSRVYGRFLYGLVFLVVCTLIGSVISISYAIKENVDIKVLLLGIIVFFGAGVLVNSLQFLVSYLFEIKNAQVLSIMRIIPGFIFFFCGSVLMEKISESQESMNAFSQVVSKIIEYKEVMAVGFLVISMLITFACMMVCAKREENKES